jgi:hypothetical protein
MFPWWRANNGLDGIHVWYTKVCEAHNLDPKSLVVCPHLKAKGFHSEEQIWNRYMLRLKKKEIRVDVEQPFEATDVRKRKHSEEAQKEMEKKDS